MCIYTLLCVCIYTYTFTYGTYILTHTPSTHTLSYQYTFHHFVGCAVKIWDVVRSA